MQEWLGGEPSLDELLQDDMMSRVVASAGMSREEFRSRLVEVATRIGARAGQSRTGQSRSRPRVAVGN